MNLRQPLCLIRPGPSAKDKAYGVFKVQPVLSCGLLNHLPDIITTIIVIITIIVITIVIIAILTIITIVLISHLSEEIDKSGVPQIYEP